MEDYIQLNIMQLRLEIWQDVIFNLSNNNKLLTGYGYSSIIPEMELAHSKDLMEAMRMYIIF